MTTIIARHADLRTHMDPGKWIRYSESRGLAIVTCPECGYGSSAGPGADGSLAFECLHPDCGHSADLTLEGWV